MYTRMYDIIEISPPDDREMCYNLLDGLRMAAECHGEDGVYNAYVIVLSEYIRRFHIKEFQELAWKHWEDTESEREEDFVGKL